MHAEPMVYLRSACLTISWHKCPVMRAWHTTRLHPHGVELTPLSVCVVSCERRSQTDVSTNPDTLRPCVLRPPALPTFPCPRFPHFPLPTLSPVLPSPPAIPSALRAPEAPVGCPMAMAPPLTFTMSRLSPNSFSHAAYCAAKAWAGGQTDTGGGSQCIPSHGLAFNHSTHYNQHALQPPNVQPVIKSRDQSQWPGAPPRVTGGAGGAASWPH